MKIGVGVSLAALAVLGGEAGSGLGSQTALQRILALSPSLLIWPEQGAGWQGTSGGSLAASGQPLGLGVDLSQLGGKTLAEWLESAANIRSTGAAGSAGTVGAPSYNTTTGEASLPRVDGGNITFITFSGTASKTYAIEINNTTANAVTVRSGSTVLATVAGNTTAVSVVNIAAGQSLGVWPSVNGVTQTCTINYVQELPGNHLRAGTWASPSNAARGTFQNNAINFDGASDYYSLLNAISITESMTVVRAFKRASAGIDSVGLSTTGTQPYDAWWRSVNDILTALNAGTNSTQASGQTQTGSFVTSTRRNATEERARLNGADLTPAAAAAVAGTFNSLGRRSTTYNSGEISFLAVFPTELTGANLALVEQIAAATNGAVLA